MRVIILSIIISILLFFSFANSSTLVWETTINHYSFIALYDMINATDSTFIAVGGQYSGEFDNDTSIVITEINMITGDTLWFKTYTTITNFAFANSIDHTLDNNYVVAGHTRTILGDENFYLLKIDPNGNIIWSNDYGTNGFERCNSVIATSDGGYLLTGRHNDQNDLGGIFDAFCVKTDSFGNLINSKKLNLDSNNIWGKHSQEMISGNYLVGADNVDNLSYIFYELDNNLDSINSFQITSNSYELKWLWRFYKNSSNNFVFGNNNSIQIFDYLGNILFDSTISSFPTHGTVEITPTDDYIFVGSTVDGGNDSLSIFEYNNLGEHLQFFYKVSDSSLFPIYYNIIKDTIDNSYIISIFNHWPSGFEDSVRILKVYPFDDYQFLNSDFKATPNEGKFPLVTAFEPISYDSNLSYFWDFGDGHTSNEAFPIHQYLGIGYFDVELTVSNSQRSRSTKKTDYIRSSELIAEFTSDIQIGLNPLEVNFSDQTIGSPNDWLWYFGDGNVSTEQNPTHLYSDTGTYSVRLKVCDNRTCDSIRSLGYIHILSELKPDLVGSLRGAEPSRPGFDIKYLIRITNIGSDTAKVCSVKCTLDPNLSLYSSSIPYDLIGNKYIWTFPEILQNDTISIYLYTNASVFLQAGDSLNSYISVNTVDQELDLSNNDASYSTVIVNSLDPNDKIVVPNESYKNNTITIEEELNYTVFFENKPEATAEAVYVFIVDTLDPNLDWSSFQVTNISHPDKVSYNFDQFTGELFCFFDSIMLPPNVSPPEGEGYISYSIKPKKTLDVGDEISNEAFIRFDYNPWLTAPESGPLIKTIRELTCCIDPTGDINNDKEPQADISDLLYLVDYMFTPGSPAPECSKEADVNGDGGAQPDISDLLYLVKFMFTSVAPAPAGCQ